MPIQYGELTIMFNKDEVDLLTNVMIWFQYEPAPPKKSTYIFSFHDGDIRDMDEDTLPKCVFTFFNGQLTPLPMYFKRPNTLPPRCYFYKRPYEKENPNDVASTVVSLDFRSLFDGYSKYYNSNGIPSCYNCIYYCNKKCSGDNRKVEKSEILGIIRIQSNEYMPRFKFAYDSDEFTKEEVMYLIYKMLTSR